MYNLNNFIPDNKILGQQVMEREGGGSYLAINSGIEINSIKVILFTLN